MLTNTYTGTAITALVSKHYKRKWNRLGKAYRLVVSFHGHSTIYKANSTINTNIHNVQTTTSNQLNNTNNSGSNSKNISIVVPYMHGRGEKIKGPATAWGSRCTLEGSNTTKTLLMAPKDRNNKLQKSGVIYSLSDYTSTAQRST